MVLFVTRAQSLENFDGLVNTRGLNTHGLEAAFQRGILLDVLPIFIQRRSTDAL